MSRTNKSLEEKPVIFQCNSSSLVGILHKSDSLHTYGVLIIVGGPQYRIGSHRQFVLLARFLANNGIPVFRFDCRGMGDSEGCLQPFHSIDDDISSAIEVFFLNCPNLSNIVLWGLCDAASASVFYAYQDKRICGMVLLNPWVYTESGSAKAYLKHYYLQRIRSPAFWHKVLTLRFNYFHSIFSLIDKAKSLLNYKYSIKNKHKKLTNNGDSLNVVDRNLDLPERMYQCLYLFKNPVLLILSGNDLVSSEFKDLIQTNRKWKKIIRGELFTRYDILEADHTFSSEKWCREVESATLNWIKKLILK